MVREDAEGRVYAVRPELFAGVADPSQIDARSAQIVAQLPADHYRVKDLKGETFDPKKQTITAARIDEEDERESEEDDE